MTSLNSVKLKNIFVIVSLCIGLVLMITTREFFTPQSLAETLLFSASLFYLLSKYFSSRIIIKYQDSGYKPSKQKRLLDDIIVNLSIHVVIPLAMSAIVASLILIIVKVFPHTLVPFTSESINPTLDFFKQKIKYPTSIFLTIIAVLVLFRYLSFTRFKSTRKLAKIVSSPINTLIFLSFFLVEDIGVDNYYLEYHFNNERIKTKDITINAANVDPERIEDVEALLEAYSSYVIDRIESKTSDLENEKNELEHFYVPHNFHRILSIVDNAPTLKENIKVQIESNSNSKSSNAKRQHREFHETVWEQKSKDVKSSNLYEDLAKKDKSFFSEFMSVLNDERSSIRVKDKSLNATIIKKLFGDFIGKCIPSNELIQDIALHDILKSKLTNLFNKKLANAFYSLVKKDRVTKRDIQKLNRYIDQVLVVDYPEVVRSTRVRYNNFTRYYAHMKRAFMQSYFYEQNQLVKNDAIEYSEGLKQRIKVYENAKQKSLTNTTERNKYFQEIKKQYPKEYRELTTEMKKEIWRKEVTAFYGERIDEIQRVIDNPGLARDYEYIRDNFSAGGIFFGEKLSFNKFSTTRNNGDKIFDEGIQWVEFEGGRLKICDDDGNYFVYSNSTNPELLLSAYNYVYANESYPVLVDGWYENKYSQTFAYNRDVMYNSSFINDLYDADNFIFDVLKKKNNNSKLRKKFGESIQKYNENKDEVSLSRIYDKYHSMAVSDTGFVINSNLMFSIVGKNEEDSPSTPKYFEFQNISNSFNNNQEWIILNYDFFQRIQEFSSYQALFRAIPEEKVDITELILPN